MVIMISVAMVLFAFSFWLIHRRTNIPQPIKGSAVAEPQIDYEWGDLENKTYGLKFSYPKNIFESNTNPVKVGKITRLFLASSAGGTITAEVFDQQFDPKNIVNESLRKVNNASALNVSGRIGYQYQEIGADCTKKVVQAPLGNQTAAMVFASCSLDQEPLVVENRELILRVLRSLELNPASSTSTAIVNWNIAADDTGASPNPIEVVSGDIAELTFIVSNANVLSGGLAFKSQDIDTGLIPAGTSKTVSFKADQSMEFAVFGSGDLRKNYTIKVNVIDE
ncbi:MAG: hypothetical protein A3H14_02930 [Candidatus Doudnabacteria bacterium RIFCSPLOWO2_12_FULL_49_8]|nr:MAG: hypothetical protein A3H14_02930 [Candidatus Doudnabacteria bacterium RIFCSPLOWO2_12_FULL_49_8]